MKEIITKEYDGKNIVLGYTTIKVSTNEAPVKNIYKVFRLTFGDVEDEGDLHVFEHCSGHWFLKQEMSLVNLNNSNLIDMYQFISRRKQITFDDFVDLMALALGLF